MILILALSDYSDYGDYGEEQNIVFLSCENIECGSSALKVSCPKYIANHDPNFLILSFVVTHMMKIRGQTHVA